MAFIKHTTTSSRRLLISGFSQAGKTTSLPSFIYGPFDPVTETTQAFEYAGDKKLVVITCPGEFGILSLPNPDTHPHITSYQLETSTEKEINNYRWSLTAIKEFEELTEEIRNNVQPDVVCIDGLHALHEQYHNRTTEGRYLNGETGVGNKPDSFLYPVTNGVFGNYLARWYNSKTPLVIMTTWEKWEEVTSESQKPLKLAQMSDAPKYRMPALMGAMAHNVIGKFDARLSAGLETRCIHKGCELSNNRELHYTWQIYPKGNVKEVGIKGLKPNKAIIDCPFIHQNYHALQGIIKACS